MKASIRVAALGALLFNASAFADDPDFSKLDADSDKSISKEEAKAHADIAARFDELDSDEWILYVTPNSRLTKKVAQKRQQRREDR